MCDAAIDVPLYALSVHMHTMYVHSINTHLILYDKGPTLTLYTMVLI